MRNLQERAFWFLGFAVLQMTLRICFNMQTELNVRLCLIMKCILEGVDDPLLEFLNIVSVSPRNLRFCSTEAVLSLAFKQRMKIGKART